MIRRLQIENFKSIRHADLELESINLFIGENGAGKSNILEALGIVSAAVYGTVDDESIMRRGVRPGVPRLYKTSNIRHKTAPHTFFSVQDDTCGYYVSLLNPQKNPKPKWNYKTERIESRELDKPHTRGVRKRANPDMGDVPMVLSTLSSDGETNAFFSRIRDYALYSPNTAALRGLVPDVSMRPPVGLMGGGLADGLKAILRQANKNENISSALEEITSLFSWVEEVDTSSQVGQILSSAVSRGKDTITFKDAYMKEDKNRLTAADASEGALYALFLFVLCLSPNSPKTFAVDNIEQALNPRLVKRLAGILQRWFREYIPEKQVLCTAHNPVLLDGFDFLDDTVHLFVVDRDMDGLTVIRRVQVTRELVQKSKEHHLSWSQLWVDGYLGGVPNV